MLKTYSADKIFTGKEWKNNAAVIIENNMVADVVSINHQSLEESMDYIIAELNQSIRSDTTSPVN